MTPDAQQHIIAALQMPDIEQPVRKLYELYYDSVVAQIAANGGNREDGADIFQEAVLVLIEKVKINEFRGDSSIKTYLSAVARNLWLFELRTRERRKKREGVYFTDEMDHLPADKYMDMKQQNNQLLSLLDTIGDTCKKILTGFYYEEKSMKELLTAFEYENEQVLRNRKSRCMKKLKELLQSNTDLLNNLKPLLHYE